MLDSKSLPIWKEIRQKLICLKEEEKIFCPLSVEHFIETSQKDEQSARKHNEFYTALSDGFCIKPELFITSQLISSRIRGNNITHKTYMYEKVKDVFAFSDNYKKFYGLNNEYRTLLTAAGTDINKLRQTTNTQKIDPKIKQAFYSVTKNLQPQFFIQRLKDLKKDDQIKVQSDKIDDRLIPNWVDSTIGQLLQRHKFSRIEVDKLIFELEKNNFNNIPTLDIKMSMLALISVYSKKETPSDHIDLTRIATGLPIADILFTDKKRKSEILELELDKKYNTKVFTGKQEDLEECLTELSKY